MELRKLNTKGQMGIGVSKAFMLGLLTLLIIGVVTVIVLKQLGATSIVSSDNDTTRIIGNGTSAISTFFGNTGTWLALLAIVVLLLIVAIVVVTVNRFGGDRGGSY